MIVRKLRLKRGWTQSQLAEMADVTSRTIQRIEQGQKPSLETCKALASVFEVDISIIQSLEQTMNNENKPTSDTQNTNGNIENSDSASLASFSPLAIAWSKTVALPTTAVANCAEATPS